MLKFKWEIEFKETEIGEIPKEWQKKSIKDLVDKNKKFPIVDGPFGTQLHMDEYVSSGIPVIRVINLTFDGVFIENDLVFISEEKFKQLTRSEVKPNDLIIAKTGATIGKLALLPYKIQRGLIASSCLKATFDISKANPKYYLYFFIHPIGQENIITRAEGGSTRPTINLTPFSEIIVPYPPPPEQSRIAKVLSWFDDLIENKKRQNEILEKTAMAIFRNWFIDFKPFKNKEFIDSELGRIPKGWEVRELKEVVKSQYGFTASSEEIGKVKLLRITDINKTFVIDWDNVPYSNIEAKSYLKYRVEHKDIIISRIADIGKVAIIENPPRSIFASYLIRLKIKPNVSITPYYLYYWLKCPIYQEYIEGVGEGSTRQNTNAEVIKEFERIAETIRKKVVLNQKQIMTLRKVRDTLLPLLVFGKLRVEEAR